MTIYIEFIGVKKFFGGTNWMKNKLAKLAKQIYDHDIHIITFYSLSANLD